MTFPELVDVLRAYGAAEVTLAGVLERLLPVLTADPLDVSATDPSPWDAAPGEQRLFWRIVYLLESEAGDEPALRALAARVVACLDRTGSPDMTHDLMPLLADQPRLCTIIERHARGIISRTGFLSVVAESGYPPHVKLWLEHASTDALALLCTRLEQGDYDQVAEGFETPPG